MEWLKNLFRKKLDHKAHQIELDRVLMNVSFLRREVAKISNKVLEKERIILQLNADIESLEVRKHQLEQTMAARTGEW